MRFDDRRDAGRRLAERLSALQLSDPLVLGLPRGGVPVAYEVATRLSAPLGVFVVRKIGAPFQPELAVGAIAEGGEPALDDQLIRTLGLQPAQLEPVIERERAELQRRVAQYRSDGSGPDVTGRDVVLVDDGLATGASARAALHALRARSPRRLVLAVPVGAPDSVRSLQAVADEVVCVQTPRPFGSVGQWYVDFRQTTDEEVLELLDRADPRRRERR